MDKSVTRTLGIIFICMLVSSCATVTGKYLGPNNREVYEIDCSGKAVAMSVCYSKAKQMCPNGYTVVSNQAPPPSTLYSEDTVDYSIAKYTESLPGVVKGITVQCK